MYKILFWQLKLVFTISIFATKMTFTKLSKMLFFVPTYPKNLVLKIFKLLYFTLPVIFPLLAIADFIEEVD